MGRRGVWFALWAALRRVDPWTHKAGFWSRGKEAWLFGRRIAFLLFSTGVRPGFRVWDD
jgi:hypothetical protein